MKQGTKYQRKIKILINVTCAIYISTGNVSMYISGVCIYLWRRGGKRVERWSYIIALAQNHEDNIPFFTSAIDFISCNSLITTAVV